MELSQERYLCIITTLISAQRTQIIVGLPGNLYTHIKLIPILVKEYGSKFMAACKCTTCIHPVWLQKDI